MAWSALIPEFSDYGAQAVFLTTFLDKTYNPQRSGAGFDTADSIKDLYLTEAKAEVLRDIQIVLSLNPDDTSDMTSIDTITTENPSRLKNAIALMQIIIVFESLAPGKDTMNYQVLIDHRNKYATMKAGYAGIESARGHATVKTRNFNG